MIENEKGPTTPKQPALAAESIIYGSVYDELDDIFDMQDGEAQGPLQLEDVVGDDLAEAAANKTETPPLDPFKILNPALEKMKDWTNQIEDATTSEELGELLDRRRKCFEDAMNELLFEANDAINNDANAAVNIMEYRWSEDGNSAELSDLTGWNLLGILRSSSDHFLNQRATLIKANVSKECMSAFDKDVFKYLRMLNDIGQKQKAVDLASNDQMKQLFRRALDADLLKHIMSQPGLEEKLAVAQQIHAFDAESQKLIRFVCDFYVFKQTDLQVPVNDKLATIEYASSPEIGAMMRAALDSDIFKTALRAGTGRVRQTLIDQASSSIEQEAMGRVLR